MSGPLRIHGRSSFRATVTFTPHGSTTAVDLSDKTLVFELKGATFRKALEPYTSGDKTERTLYLSRSEVAKIPVTATAFAILDETVPGGETTMDGGLIQRVGWVKS